METVIAESVVSFSDQSIVPHEFGTGGDSVSCEEITMWAHAEPSAVKSEYTTSWCLLLVVWAAAAARRVTVNACASKSGKEGNESGRKLHIS